MTVMDALACAAIAAPALVCICLAVAGALDDRSASDRSGSEP